VGSISHNSRDWLFPEKLHVHESWKEGHLPLWLGCNWASFFAQMKVPTQRAVVAMNRQLLQEMTEIATANCPSECEVDVPGMRSV
jgi:hypothetical protein